jgi:hypothetical protein
MAAATSFSFEPHLRPIHPDRPRRAGAEFVRQTSVGCTRRDVAEWLVCQYAPSTVRVRRDQEPRSGCRLASVEERVLEEVVGSALTHVLAVLADLTMPDRAARLARSMLASEAILRIHDRIGRRTYAAVDKERMSLADRVSSLFVADWLHRPQDYRVIQRCRDCGALEIGAVVEHSPWCDESRLIVEMSVA